MADNTVTLKITGLKELEDALERKPLEAARKIMRNAVQPAAQIWVEEMKTRVRRGWHVFQPSKRAKRRGRDLIGRTRDFGFIASHIGMHTRVTSDLAATVEVGPMKKAFWSLFLEFGTSKMHAFPFIRQSFEAQAKQVLDKFIEGVKQGLRDAGLPLH